jgi:RNA polymerase sigma-70 factor (ECF subfamily)
VEISDKEYVRRCRNGHPEDFRVLVNRYQKSVFSFLATKLGNRSDIEDAAQESFVRAFTSLRKIRKPESFHSWLLGIAKRVALEQHHVQKQRRLECEIEKDIEAAPSDNQETNSTNSLDEAIAALPENYRRLILMRYYEGIPCHEIGMKLELPLGTVTKTLSRAYALLRKELQARGDFK